MLHQVTHPGEPALPGKWCPQSSYGDTEPIDIDHTEFTIQDDMLLISICFQPLDNMAAPKLSYQWKLISASANYWFVFSVPLAFSVFIVQMILHQVYPFDKYQLEEAALLVTSGFCLMCFARFVYNKDKFFLWAAAMMLVLWIREIHPPGSSGGVYLGLLALFYIAHKNHHLFAGYIINRRVVTMFGTGFFTYFISVTTDQRWWKFIPAERIFQNRLEESMELVGHILVGSALLFASSRRQPEITQASDSAESE